MLHKYQKEAVNFLNKDYTGQALFIDMGLGKTLITLEYLNQNKHKFNKVLIVAPLKVAEHVWSGEIQKWGYDFSIVKVLGGWAERIEKLKKKAFIYIVNVENLKWLIESHWKKFDCLIIDELSMFKASNTKRFKFLRKKLHQFKKIIGLTGTPAPNGLYDLYSQLYLLDQGDRLGKYKKNFQEEFFTPGLIMQRNVCSWILRKGQDKVIQDRIADICISIKNEGLIDLPDMKTIIHKIDFSYSVLTRYKKFKRDLVLEFADGNITAKSAAILCGKLQQFANGCCYYSDVLDKSYEVIHEDKIKALQELIEAAKDNVLVYYWFRSDLIEIKKNIGTAEELNVEKWNEGKQRVALAHPASCGHGLNLQDGGHIMIWFGPIYSLELYQQAIARLYRQGQPKMVLNYIISVEKSIDTGIIKILDKKKATQQELIDALQIEFYNV